MSERKRKFTPFINQCLVTAAVSSNMMGFGCQFGFPGIMLPQLQSPGSPIPVSKEQASWIASVGSIPMIFGNFFITPMMSRLGRKVSVYSATLTMFLGWLVVCLATSYEALLIGRVLQGLSSGMFLPLRSIFIGECSSPRYRAGFLAATTLAQVSGLFLVHLTGSFLSYQLTALICTSFPFICVLLTIYLPESPSWLATQGQYDKCSKNFIRLRGEDEIPELDKLIQSVKHYDTQNANHSNQFSQIIMIVKKKEFFKPVFIVSTLFIMQNHGGGPLLAAYPVMILKSLLGPEVNPHFWMVALDFLRLLFCAAAIYLMNKVKRRTMVFTIGAINAGSQLAMGLYVFARVIGYFSSDVVWIPGILITVQSITLAIGMQSLPAVIAGEVFPLQHRGLAASIVLVMQCVSVLIVLKSFPTLMSVMGLQGSYVLYFGVVAICLAVAWVLLPETSGRTLQQIEEHFRGALLPDLEADKETVPFNDMPSSTLENKTNLH